MRVCGRKKLKVSTHIRISPKKGLCPHEHKSPAWWLFHWKISPLSCSVICNLFPSVLHDGLCARPQGSRGHWYFDAYCIKQMFSLLTNRSKHECHVFFGRTLTSNRRHLNSPVLLHCNLANIPLYVWVCQPRWWQKQETVQDQHAHSWKQHVWINHLPNTFAYEGQQHII